VTRNSKQQILLKSCW